MENNRRVTREGYMRSLRENLKKLPKQDRETAMEYFTEYFDEAGPENEAQAIEDLGSPKQAAEQIIMELAVKNSEEQTQVSVKRGVSSVWVGVLAVFAAPIAIPLALALVAVLLAVGVSVVSVLASVVFSLLALAGGGVALIVLSAVMLFRSTANALVNLGVGFLFLGAALLICPPMICLTRAVLRWLTKIFGKIVRKFTKGGERHEKR